MEDEIYYEEQYEEPSGDDTEIPAQDAAEPVETDPAETDTGDVGDIIDDLLEQIEAGQSFGSMGDYFVPAVGCYAFPGEDCFYHFIGEEERSGWIAASNGCYVPVGSLEAYESYLSSGSPGESTEGDEEQLPPPVSQEDLAGIQKTLNAMYQQDAIYYEAVMENNLQRFQDVQEIKGQLTVISVVMIVLCVFLAILCGKSFADTFFNRMRAG